MKLKKKIKIDPMSILGGQWDDPALQSTETGWVHWPNNLCRFVKHQKKKTDNTWKGKKQSNLRQRQLQHQRQPCKRVQGNFGQHWNGRGVFWCCARYTRQGKKYHNSEHEGGEMFDFVRKVFVVVKFQKPKKSPCLKNFKLNYRQTYW